MQEALEAQHRLWDKPFAWWLLDDDEEHEVVEVEDPLPPPPPEEEKDPPPPPPEEVGPGGDFPDETDPYWDCKKEGIRREPNTEKQKEE